MLQCTAHGRPRKKKAQIPGLGVAIASNYQIKIPLKDAATMAKLQTNPHPARE